MRLVQTMLGAIGTVAVVAALGAGGGSAVAAASAAAAKTSSCQAAFTESRGPSALTATGVTCANARKVAAQVAAAAPSGCIVSATRKHGMRLRTPCVRLRYRCTATAGKHGSLRVTCSRASARIRFTY